ncbi:MAG: hypothetical protein ACREI3_12410 [Nitrospirales bacterium]
MRSAPRHGRDRLGPWAFGLWVGLLGMGLIGTGPLEVTAAAEAVQPAGAPTKAPAKAPAGPSGLPPGEAGPIPKALESQEPPRAKEPELKPPAEPKADKKVKKKQRSKKKKSNKAEGLEGKPSKAPLDPAALQVRLQEIRHTVELALGQLSLAIESAERALSPERSGSRWTRHHMQRVLNILQGAGGPDFLEEVDHPGDGHGVMPYLQEAHRRLIEDDGPSPDLPKIFEAIDHGLAYVQAAGEHAKRSVGATGVDDVNEFARLATGLLVAARGVSHAEVPVTGTLTYAMTMLSREAPDTKPSPIQPSDSEPGSESRLSPKEPPKDENEPAFKPKSKPTMPRSKRDLSKSRSTGRSTTALSSSPTRR